MATKTVHMCLSVRGALRNAPGSLRGFAHDDGRKMSTAEAFESLCDELAKGHEVIPMGDACEGFDYKSGCPGHPDVSGTAESKP
jgi:hypothetical protein